MATYETPNCGSSRKYIFRKLKGQVLRFRVRAAHDANLCLTTADGETPANMYEVFLCGWNGRDSCLRKNKKQDLHKVNTQGYINQHEFKGFWIVITNDAIKVGREGDSTPFLRYTDPSRSIRPTHYGYCTAYGSSGSWTFSDDDPTYFGPKLDMKDVASALDDILKPKPVLINVGFAKPKPPPSFSQQPPPPPYSQHPPSYAAQASPSYPVSPPAPTLPLQWMYCSGGSTCPSPVAAGPGASPPLVATARHQGGLVPGVLHPGTTAAHIPWGGAAQVMYEYYLLSNTGGAELEWIPSSSGQIPTAAIQGGRSEAGEDLFIGRVRIGGAYVSGKVHPSHRQCYITDCGAERGYGNYEVLCLTAVPLALLGVE